MCVLTAAGPASVRAVLAVGALEETVVVEAASSIVQTQSAAVATTMDINQISNLPLTSRSALDFVTNLPGINTPAAAATPRSTACRRARSTSPSTA